MHRQLITRYIVLTLLLTCFVCTGVRAQDNVTFNYEDEEDFIFCLEDTTQTINIVPNPTLTVSEIIVTWILGETDPIVISGLTYTDIYPAARILDRCSYGLGTTGEEFNTRVVANYTDGSSENLTRTVTFRKPPQLTISGGGTYCVGQTARLNVRLCPDNDPTAEDVIWTLPDGTEVLNESFIDFPTDVAGSFVFRVSNMNDCGSGQTSTTVTVLDAPNALAVADSNVITVNQDTFRLCYESGTRDTIRINSSESTGLTSQSWVVGGASGARILDRNGVFSEVEISRAGNFTFTVRGRNENCNVSAEDDFILQVIETSVLRLEEQRDECISLDYEPRPFTDGAIYEVDGMVITDFPVTLGVGQHTVLARLPPNDICPTLPLRDTFVVLSEETAVIATPADTLCDQDESVTFTASPASGGIWRIDGEVFNGTIDPGSLAGGTYTITYGNEPCLVSDETTLTVLGTVITVPEPTQLCIDQGVIDFANQVSPPGGTFSGNGVNEAGRFDPAAAGIGLQTLTYIFINPSDTSCRNSSEFQVDVSELAADFETGDCDGSEVCFELPAGEIYDSQEWNFDGLGSSSLRDPCFPFPGDGVYEVTVTVTRGPCEATYSELVTIAPAPAPAFTLDADSDGCSELLVAINNTSGTGDFNYNWLLNGVTFSEVADPDTLRLSSVLQDSTFTISLELSNACATNTAPEQSVVTRPSPVARFGTTLSDRYCSGDTIRLANNSFGGVETYRWTLDGEVIGTSADPPFIMPETDTVRGYELCLSATNSCGDSTLCQSINVFPTDVTALFSAPSTVCAGEPVSFTNLATNGVDVVYDFDNGDFSSTPNPTTVFDVPGTYLVRQRAFSADCGSAEFPQEITVIESPVADFNMEVGCPGIPVRFNNLGNEAFRSVWDFGDGSPAVEEFSPEHTFDATDTFEVCLTVTPLLPNACSRTRCRMVEITAPPVAGFTATDSVCVGQAVTFTSLVNSGLTCRYIFDDGDFSSDCNTTHVYAGSGLFSVSQIVGDERGCRDTVTEAVFVRPLPIPSFTVDDTGSCAPSTITFTNDTPQGDSYLWEFGDGNTSTATNAGNDYPEPGTYEVTLTATTGGICTATTTAEVVIDETPVALIEPSRTMLCLGETLDLANVSTGTVSEVRWDLGDDSFSFEDNPSDIRYEAPGLYTVSLIANNNDLCLDTTSVDITVHPPVDAVFGEQRDVRCNGEATGLLSIETTSGLSPFNYAWSNGAIATVNPELPAGIYMVTITDGNQCTAVFTDSIVEPPSIEPAADVEVVTCFGGSDGSIRLAATGGTGPYQIDWPGGSTEEVFTGLAAGDYPVTITDDNDCVVERNITVPENPEIVVIDSLLDISCFGEMDGVFTLRDISGGVGPYAVSLAGPDYLMDGTTVDRFDNLGPGIYSFTYTDAVGCGDAFEFEVVSPDEVTLNILDDTIFLNLGESVPLDNRFNAADPTFFWSPGSGLSCVDCPTPIARPFDPLITYFALLTDGNGCTATDQVTAVVSIDREVYIPNTFTPNQDGRNDLFRVRSAFPAGIDTVEVFQVFDRWGQVVFEEREFPPNIPAYGWDGRKNGEPVQLGVYVYQVVVRYVDGERVVISGKVELLR